MKNRCFIVDSNSLISAFLLSTRTTPARAWYKALELGDVVFSEETFAEFADVFIRPKFDRYVATNKRLSIIEDLKESSRFIAPIHTITICRDIKDNKYLELALSAKVDCIITGDDDLLILNPFEGTPILSASIFLETY